MGVGVRPGLGNCVGQAGSGHGRQTSESICRREVRLSHSVGDEDKVRGKEEKGGGGESCRVPLVTGCGGTSRR